MEGVAGGVGLLAWPMEADQFVNAKMALAVPDCNKLARIIIEPVNGDQSLLSRATGLSDKARNAVAKGGSSVADLDRLAEDFETAAKQMTKCD